MVIRETTQERAVREKVEEQDRLAAMGQLAAGIAHDFNNILTSIIGYSQLLSMRPDTPGPAKGHLQQIVSQGSRAAQLVRQILDFSRKTAVERQPLDLVLLLKEAVKLLERTIPESIQIVAEWSDNEYVVEANLTQLQQVITNLAVNAKDAMPNGGELRIKLSSLHLDPEERPPLPEMEPGDWAVWTVSDTGAGMPAEVLKHIYEPFFTTKQPGEGTGLGLAQVYGIVKQHKGTIEVESELGQGTTFRIYLPQTGQAKAPLQQEEAYIPTGDGETILVVEDESVVRQVVRSMLEDRGYRVITASNGQNALEVYESHCDEVQLVVTDLVMPEMGG